MSTDTFAVLYDGRTWTVDIADAGPDHAIARARHEDTVLYQGVMYSKDPHTGVEVWRTPNTGSHVTLDAARDHLTQKQKFTAEPDSRLVVIARAAILRFSEAQPGGDR